MNTWADMFLQILLEQSKKFSVFPLSAEGYSCNRDTVTAHVSSTTCRAK